MFTQQFIGNQICFVSDYCFRSAGKFPLANKGCKSLERVRIHLCFWNESRSKMPAVLFGYTVFFVMTNRNSMPEQAIAFPLFSKVNVKMKQSQMPY